MTLIYNVVLASLRREKRLDPRITVSRIIEVARGLFEETPAPLKAGQQLVARRRGMVFHAVDRSPKHMTPHGLTSDIHGEAHAEGVDFSGVIGGDQRHPPSRRELFLHVPHGRTLRADLGALRLHAGCDLVEIGHGAGAQPLHVVVAGGLLLVLQGNAVGLGECAGSTERYGDDRKSESLQCGLRWPSQAWPDIRQQPADPFGPVEIPTRGFA